MVVKADGEFLTRKDPNDWLFADVERLFDLVVSTTKSKQKTYDLFGHSAGGQFAHRFALFNPQSRANKILAANSGWYTVVDHEALFPFGLSGAPLTKTDLEQTIKQSFF